MGRPKMSQLTCKCCQLKFKRKRDFDDHMKIHSSMKECDKKTGKSNPTSHQNGGSRKSVSKITAPIKCSICGKRCKSKKGLKIHICAHKRSQDNCNNEAPQCENKNDSINNNSNIPLLVSNNGDINFTRNAQPNSILNTSHFQIPSTSFGNYLNFNNQAGINIENQPSAGFLQSAGNQETHFSNIPKFDCSNKYMKWLKNFVSSCLKYDYPLSPELCRKICHVNEELTDALGNPKSSLKDKSNHFYFMSMYNNLSEIMLKHLQYLCGVNE